MIIASRHETIDRCYLYFGPGMEVNPASIEPNGLMLPSRPARPVSELAHVLTDDVGGGGATSPLTRL